MTNNNYNTSFDKQNLTCSSDDPVNFLEPKIYAACLAAYNAGYLHGIWIDASQSLDLILSEIKTMLSNSSIPNAEEWAIHDYEDFGSICLDEYSDLETVVSIADVIKKYGKLGAEIVAYHGNYVNDARNALDNYCGEYDSKVDYAKQLMNDCSEVPEYFQFYIDYDKFARDLFISDNYSIDVNNKCHVFSCV